jgi:diketogulonate reductase-like aldo/keto reductase
MEFSNDPASNTLSTRANRDDNAAIHPKITSRIVRLPTGEVVPALGQGTWHFAEDPEKRRDEIDALRLGLDLGMTLIDTAEMYADGAAEILVGEAISGRRDDVFLVSKVLPENATERGTVLACESSLRRLRTNRLDLYLLHWRGNIPLEETLAGFDALMAVGKIRHWGVSNFDVADMIELNNLALGRNPVTNQVLDNLARRGIELDLMPWCARRAIPIMAYSPIMQAQLLDDIMVNLVAARHDATPAQVALACVLRTKGVIAIPRAGRSSHVRENRGALDLALTDDDLADLDRAFPSPSEQQPLAMF